MGWFNNKKITLLSETGGYLYHGTWVDGTLTAQKTIVCDVQPASRELIFKEYGYYVDCIYRAFCDVDNDLKEGSIVEYNGNQYKVVKIVLWDDFMDIFINSMEASGNE